MKHKNKCELLDNKKKLSFNSSAALSENSYSGYAGVRKQREEKLNYLVDKITLEDLEKIMQINEIKYNTIDKVIENLVDELCLIDELLH